MKCQILFSGKNIIVICRISPANGNDEVDNKEFSFKYGSWKNMDGLWKISDTARMQNFAVMQNVEIFTCCVNVNIKC